MVRQEAWRLGSERLQQAQVADARWQAELLLRSALGESRARFLASLSEPADEARLARYWQWIDRRQAGTPLQYLVGVQEFMGLELVVTPAVLIPRPDTEVLVEETIRLLSGEPAPRVVDLATGSGAIALSLVSQLPKAEVFATDLSPDALQVARDNAERLGLAGRIKWRQGSWLEPLADEGGWTAIVSNPPYIPTADLAKLSPEVQLEPHLALDGGVDGLACYRELIPQAAAALAPGGYLLLEVGAGQAPEVRQLLLASGLVDPYFVRDLAGIERVVVGRHH